MHLHTFTHLDELNLFAVELFDKTCREAVASRGRFTVALAGGNSYRKMYEMLASHKDLPWDKVHVFWGDERCVPQNHPDSNAGMSFESLLNHVPIPSAQIHIMQGDLQPKVAGEKYETLLREKFPNGTGMDLVLLGLGDDGHTASLFPGTSVLEEKERWAQCVFIPNKTTYRLTLTAPFINRARRIIFITYGENKSNAVWEVLKGSHEPELFPAQMIHPKHGDVWWLVDDAAANMLEK